MPESIKPLNELDILTQKAETATLENLRSGVYSKEQVKYFIEEEERAANYMEKGKDEEMRQKLIDSGFVAKSRAKAQGYKNALDKFESSR